MRGWWFANSKIISLQEISVKEGLTQQRSAKRIAEENPAQLMWNLQIMQKTYRRRAFIPTCTQNLEITDTEIIRALTAKIKKTCWRIPISSFTLEHVLVKFGFKYFPRAITTRTMKLCMTVADYTEDNWLLVTCIVFIRHFQIKRVRWKGMTVLTYT